MGPSKIVLVDCDGTNNAQFAKTIRHISSCNPLVIGINYQFDEADAGDSTLCNSIASSGKVILPQEISGDSITGSDYRVAKNAAGQGVIAYAYKGDDIIGPLLLVSFGEKILWSFAIRLIGESELSNPAKVDKMDSLLAYIKPHVGYRSKFSYSLNSFKVLSADSSLKMDCSAFKSKIILLGSLAKGTEDVNEVMVEGRGIVQMPNTLIIANVVADLIETYPEEIEQSWWDRVKSWR